MYAAIGVIIYVVVVVAILCFNHGASEGQL